MLQMNEVVDEENNLSLLLSLIIGCPRETGRVWIGDGRAVIFNDLTEDHQYDYILHDIFSGNNWIFYSTLFYISSNPLPTYCRNPAGSQSAHLFTQEVFLEIKQHLKKNGVFVLV